MNANAIRRMHMSEYTEYPCIKIGETIHITVTGSKCACGRDYDYEEQATSPKDTVIIKSPLIWRTLSEVTCPACQNEATKKENREKMEIWQ